MIALLKYFDGPWEQVRQYLREDMDHLEAAINQRWAATFKDDNTLKAAVIGGDSTTATRYIANTGASNAPKWDQVNLSNGVKSRLPFAHFVQSTTDAVLVGRESGSSGDFEQLTVGPSGVIDGTNLYDIGGVVSMHQLCGGI